jgi:exonuclease VII small subunit|tara:strand:- start:67 stop:339 length:273 start_codon:yes stop_codon:yes gene_type:complete
MNKEISLTELQQDSLELSIRTDIETSQNILEDSLNELEDIKLGYSSSNYDGMNTLEQCENQIKRYRQHLRSLYAVYEKLGHDSSYLKGDR